MPDVLNLGAARARLRNGGHMRAEMPFEAAIMAAGPIL